MTSNAEYIKQLIENSQTIGFKIGSNLNVTENSEPDHERIRQIAQTAEILVNGFSKNVFLIVSGAIPLGRKIVPNAKKPFAASLGNRPLFNAYANEFKKNATSHILETHKAISEHKKLRNLQNLLKEAFSNKAIVIINANDATEDLEINKDNDELAAITAIKVANADCMIYLSQNALYTGDPRDQNSEHVPLVTDIDDLARFDCSTDTYSKHSTGGMATKAKSISILMEEGIPTILADGTIAGCTEKLRCGENGVETTIFDTQLSYAI